MRNRPIVVHKLANYWDRVFSKFSKIWVSELIELRSVLIPVNFHSSSEKYVHCLFLKPLISVFLHYVCCWPCNFEFHLFSDSFCIKTSKSINTNLICPETNRKLPSMKKRYITHTPYVCVFHGKMFFTDCNETLRLFLNVVYSSPILGASLSFFYCC